MELSEQSDLIRKFMLAIAGEVTHYCLRTNVGPSATAHLTMERAMHLAAQFAIFQDEAISNKALQQEAAGSNQGLPPTAP